MILQRNRKNTRTQLGRLHQTRRTRRSYSALLLYTSCNTPIGRKKRSTISRLENFSRNGSTHPNKKQKLDDLKERSTKENKEVSRKTNFYPCINLPWSIRIFQYAKTWKKPTKRGANYLSMTCKENFESKSQKEPSRPKLLQQNGNSMSSIAMFALDPTLFLDNMRRFDAHFLVLSSDRMPQSVITR